MTTTASADTERNADSDADADADPKRLRRRQRRHQRHSSNGGTQRRTYGGATGDEASPQENALESTQAPLSGDRPENDETRLAGGLS